MAATSTSSTNGITAASAIEDLANSISKASATLASFVQQQNESNTPTVAGSFAIRHDAPADIMAAKRVLLETTASLQQLIMSPADFHAQCTTNLQQLGSYRWLVSFSIPDHVPLGTAIEYHAIAQQANVPEQQLIRFARLAMTGGFFHEPTPGHIAHTPLSAGFCSDAALRDGMLLLTETNLPTVTKVVEMTTDLQQNAPQPPKTAFQIAHNTSLPFFPYLSQNPQIAKRLASGMRSIAASIESSPSHLLESFDWSALPSNAHIIDLGGSHGHVSLFLAQHYPSLRFTVQDLAPVIKSAAPVPLELQGRVGFEAHSFLDPQPESNQSGADVLLIRQCLNNWPDAASLKILKNLVSCLTKPHSRILINQIVVPAPFSTRVEQGVLSAEKGEAEGDERRYGEGSRAEALARTRDVVMMQLMDGGERDLEQWRRLLRGVDERLEIVAVRKPELSLLSLIEVRLRQGEVG